MIKEYTSRRQSDYTVRYIEPSRVKDFNGDRVIIVNRVRLNSRNIEIIISGQIDSEQMRIIEKAISSMHSKDRKEKRVGFGAEMTVRDVLSVFDNIDSMPRNSFALINSSAD